MKPYFALGVLGTALAAVPAAVDETCHAFTGQFAKGRICVGSGGIRK